MGPCTKATPEQIIESEKWLRLCAGSFGVDIHDPVNTNFLKHLASVQAQQQAYVRHLNNLLHIPSTSDMIDSE